MKYFISICDTVFAIRCFQEIVVLIFFKYLFHKSLTLYYNLWKDNWIHRIISTSQTISNDSKYLQEETQYIGDLLNILNINIHTLFLLSCRL